MMETLVTLVPYIAILLLASLGFMISSAVLWRAWDPLSSIPGPPGCSFFCARNFFSHGAAHSISMSFSVMRLMVGHGGGHLNSRLAKTVIRLSGAICQQKGDL